MKLAKHRDEDGLDQAFFFLISKGLDKGLYKCLIEDLHSETFFFQ